MAQVHSSESIHERRITWSLIAVVILFVLLMTCIVLWVTSSLIRQDLKGGKGSGDVTASASAANFAATSSASTPTSGWLTPGDIKTISTASTTSTPSSDLPLLMDATWTPAPGSGHYVRFNYWYVRPSKIHVGECLQITWVTEFAVHLKMLRNDELLMDDLPPSSTLKDCPTQVGYAVYKLVATNSQGETNFIQLQVKVEETP